MLSDEQETRLKNLLAQMTLEEKIGQLYITGGSIVGAFGVSFEDLVNMYYDKKITKEELMQKLSSASVDYHEDDLRAGKIGFYGGINDLETSLRLQRIAVDESRLGIPLLFGFDVIHGHRTITPIPLGESCAWDPDLWKRTAQIAADEATAYGINLTYAPMVDVAKDARWGRIAECAGEDTLLNAKYGEAKVKGFQGKDLSKPGSIAACVKHFAGYGMAEAGRDYNRVDVSEQRLCEEILPAFKACVKAGARAVMPAFNDLSGIPCSVNKWLLTEVLRNEWKFDGLTLSDANAVAECVVHGIASDRADAAKKSLEAGMDVDMTSNCYRDNLKALVESGKLDIGALNRSVENVLRVKFELGLFDNPYRSSQKRFDKTILTHEKRTLAREAAQKSIILLNNRDNILPLNSGTKIGVFGSLANSRDDMTGTWAVAAKREDCVSIIDACEAQGVSYEYMENAESVNVLDCDVFLAAVGETKLESGEAASRTNIELGEKDIKLLKLLLASGKPVIAVLFNGRPLVIGWLKEHVHTILEAWHPGIEAGNAILDILFGKVVPSAKLTTSFPNASGECPIYYDHINTGRPGGKSKFTSKYLDVPIDPVYPFGYGLSYTTFEYSGLTAIQSTDGIAVSVKVKNTGKCTADEIVQCYIHDPVAKRVRPVKKLVDFSKIHLSSDQSKKVSFLISFEKLGYYDSNMNFTIDDGEIEILVGGCSEGCLSQTVDITYKK